MSDNPLDAHPHHGRARLTFSGTEALHLLVGTLALTFIFAVLRNPYPERFDAAALLQRLVPDPTMLAASFVAVTTGFVLHELAHKLVAQRYGFWAEFRAQFKGLAFSLLLAVFTPLLFAAPGAVWIQGRATARQSAVISLVGPGLNFVVALAAFPFCFATNPTDLVPAIFTMVTIANALLAVFNLLPISLGAPLDGRKVWWWSKAAWAVSMTLAVALLVWVLVVLRPDMDV